MKFIKYITPALFCAALTLQSCEHFLDTKPMESYSEDLVWSLKSTADAFVLQTYNNVLPFYHDIRTEEQWTLNSVMRQNCPNEARDLMNRDWGWGFNQFGTIRRCNLIIEKSQASTGLSDADKKALVAEGKMLRAMTYYYIAKHCGRVIWVDHVLAETDEFNLPLTESIDKTYDLILKDIDDAIAGLPESSLQGRINANAARALKSEVCLTAAAYSTDDTRKKSLFEQTVAAVDGIQGYTLDSNYGSMFNQDGAKTSPEIILARYYSKDNTNGAGTLMQEMLPNQSNKRLEDYGGRPFFNQDLVFECWLEHSPSQNLVDAFPAANGYPISDPKASYDPQNPYANRDPRLALYIIYNGCKAGASNSVITTAVDGNNNDAMNKFDGASTRTGYYLRKFLDMNVNANPSNTTNGFHIKPWIRYTEIFLGYAAAANEAWGPQGKGTHGYSAYDVIKAIRQRAGIGENGGDPYLESVKNDKDAMRDLIRNERRLELCFEGFRFWDLRRWKVDLSKLNETVKGMKITGTNYEVVEVEKRDYKDYMYYGPVPYGEILKFNALIQNKGW